MKALKLAATLLSTLVLAAIGATSAEAATPHLTGVSGFEFSATSTEGRFAGTASGDLSGAWWIWVKHTDLGRCFNPPSDPPPCTVDDGTFMLGSTNPAEVVTGRFDNAIQAREAVPPVADQIQRLNPGDNCTDQVFSITDGLNSVGTGSQHSGTGTFTAKLTHHQKRDPFFHRCFTYAATVQGTVVLSF